MAIALAGAKIFTGTHFLSGHSILIEDGIIIDALPTKEVPRAAQKIILNGGILAPGFIDAQVNGGGGVLFNERPTVEGITAIITAHREFGTTGLLPTLITDRDDVTNQAIAAAKIAVKTIPGCLGLHLEGPHLAPARKGAHLAALMRPMQAADVQKLSNVKNGVLLVTVAVEQITPQQIETLSKAGVIVSLGHSDAPYEIAIAAIEAGARGITHLFNAMSQITSRAPGLVGAALAHNAVWCGIIADGFHVHPETLKVALQAKVRGKVFLVSDAMSTVGAIGADAKRFTLNDRLISRDDGPLTLADGTLAGSALDMAGAVRNCVKLLGVSLEEALRMASLYPAQFLKLSHKRGRIRKGMIADIVHLDDKLHVTQTWVAGR
jgi:N-acetylglucosamine-6-phosphate deacetylase